MTFLEILIAVVVGIAILCIGGLGKIFIYDNKKSIWIWFKKQKLKIFPVNFDIAFSLDFEEGLNGGQYFQQIKNDFQKILNDTGLAENIKIIDFSDIYKFRTKKDAEKFRNKKNIDLIIWGDFSCQGLKEKGELVSEIDFNFTCGHPKDKSGKLGEMILLDIGSKFAQKEYCKIFEDDSLSDIKIISNNIFDLSMYIVGLTLKICIKLEASINIFEKLLARLQNRKDTLASHVIFHLKNCYSLIVLNSMGMKKQFNKGKEFCEKIIALDGKNLFAICNLATLQYKTGQTEEAEKKVELMLELYPRHSLTEINVAFIRILQRNYNNAFKHYENLVRMGKIDFEPFEVIEFLDNEYKNSKEPALLYASGILFYYWGEKELGKDDLRLFIKKSNDMHYKKMRRKARRLIKNKL